MAIDGAHILVYGRDAEADRSFFRDVLGFPHVDAGGGWLIFGFPPAEVAIHPGEMNGQELFFMCEDLDSTLADLTAHGVAWDEIEDQGWGRVSYFRLPGGSRIGIYQPHHPRATDL